MKYAEPLSAHPARMSLTPKQQSLIAAAYDKAAFDINLPARTRAAFAKKADWFRLLARIGEKRETANASAATSSVLAPADAFGFIAS